MFAYSTLLTNQLLAPSIASNLGFSTSSMEQSADQKKSFAPILKILLKVKRDY